MEFANRFCKDYETFLGFLDIDYFFGSNQQQADPNKVEYSTLSLAMKRLFRNLTDARTNLTEEAHSAILEDYSYIMQYLGNEEVKKRLSDHYGTQKAAVLNGVLQEFQNDYELLKNIVVSNKEPCSLKDALDAAPKMPHYRDESSLNSIRYGFLASSPEGMQQVIPAKELAAKEVQLLQKQREKMDAAKASMKGTPSLEWQYMDSALNRTLAAAQRLQKAADAGANSETLARLKESYQNRLDYMKKMAKGYGDFKKKKFWPSAADKQRMALADELNQFTAFEEPSPEKDMKQEMLHLAELRKNLADSNKNVWGKPSPQWAKMETAFKEVEEAAKKLQEDIQKNAAQDAKNPGVLSENRKKLMQTYQDKLSALRNKADDYVQYKEKQPNLKAKERKRIDMAKQLTAFGESRYKFMDSNQDFIKHSVAYSQNFVMQSKNVQHAELVAKEIYKQTKAGAEAELAGEKFNLNFRQQMELNYARMKHQMKTNAGALWGLQYNDRLNWIEAKTMGLIKASDASDAVKASADNEARADLQKSLLWSMAGKDGELIKSCVSFMTDGEAGLFLREGSLSMDDFMKSVVKKRDDAQKEIDDAETEIRKVNKEIQSAKNNMDSKAWKVTTAKKKLAKMQNLNDTVNRVENKAKYTSEELAKVADSLKQAENRLTKAEEDYKTAQKDFEEKQKNRRDTTKEENTIKEAQAKIDAMQSDVIMVKLQHKAFQKMIQEFSNLGKLDYTAMQTEFVLNDVLMHPATSLCNTDFPNRDEQELLVGVHALSEIARQGMEAWKILSENKVSLSDPEKFKDNIADYLTMRIVDMECRRFAEKVQYEPNPILADLGNIEKVEDPVTHTWVLRNNTEKLKDAVKQTPLFQKMAKMTPEQISSLANNNSEKADKMVENTMFSMLGDRYRKLLKNGGSPDASREAEQRMEKQAGNKKALPE